MLKNIWFFSLFLYPPSPASVKVPVRGKIYKKCFFYFIFVMCVICPPPSPPLASVKVPFRGEQYRKTLFSKLVFMSCMISLLQIVIK